MGYVVEPGCLVVKRVLGLASETHNILIVEFGSEKRGCMLKNKGLANKVLWAYVIWSQHVKGRGENGKRSVHSHFHFSLTSNLSPSLNRTLDGNRSVALEAAKQSTINGLLSIFSFHFYYQFPQILTNLSKLNQKTQEPWSPKSEIKSI